MNMINMKLLSISVLSVALMNVLAHYINGTFGAVVTGVTCVVGLVMSFVFVTKALFPSVVLTDEVEKVVDLLVD